MDEVISKKRCTGCTACMNICPVNAIEMQKDENGFEYPTIDKEKCINCGLCKKTCPVLNTNKNESVNKCFAGFSKENSMDDKSSSGGIFSLIAEYILHNKGIVVGAAFDSGNNLVHVAVDNEEELKKLKGSKYLQSSLKDIYKYIKQNIENKKVLFVGTPCQVAGIKAFLNKEHENLFCIDLVCHGVPSPMLFKKYISELEEQYNDKLVSYNFRDKSTGWDTYSSTAVLYNNTIKEIRTKNDYMKLFLSDIGLRECCYNCNFKIGNKYSDITLGDFWGIKNYYPEMYNKNGVSAIIINTEKGSQMMDLIKDQMVYKECQLDEIIKGNASLYKSPKVSSKREKFFKDINVMTIKKLTRLYGKKYKFSTKLKKKLKKILKIS